MSGVPLSVQHTARFPSVLADRGIYSMVLMVAVVAPVVLMGLMFPAFLRFAIRKVQTLPLLFTGLKIRSGLPERYYLLCLSHTLQKMVASQNQLLPTMYVSRKMFVFKKVQIFKTLNQAASQVTFVFWHLISFDLIATPLRQSQSYTYIPLPSHQRRVHM